MIVQRRIQAVILLLDVADGDAGADLGLVQDHRQIEALGLPVLAQVGEFQHLRLADHVFEFPEAHLGHELADFLGDEEHEVDDVLRLAGEFLAKLGVLRGDADGAGVEVADAHHDAAGGDQRAGAEAEFLRAEQGADDDIAAGFQLAVGLQDDPPAKIVQDERLLRFGDAHFPGDAGIFDAREG